MNKDVKVLSQLNKILTCKLTAINQYFLHARMLKNQGFLALDKAIYQASIAEMRHADHLIERILLLDGLPNLQELGKLYIGETAEEMLRSDYKIQGKDILAIKTAIQTCEQQKDFVSRVLLEEILEQQEDHYDWLETQVNLLSELGIERYLQSQLNK